MFLLCTGKQPFFREEKIEIHPTFNLVYKLADYCESETFTPMVDFISKLIEIDPSKRMTAEKALAHPWLKASPLSMDSTDEK